MKYLRIISIALCCLMLIGIFVACNREEAVETETEAVTTAEQTEETTTETEKPKSNGETPKEDDKPPYTGPAIRNETWNTDDITPGSSTVNLTQGANDPSVDWN